MVLQLLLARRQLSARGLARLSCVNKAFSKVQAVPCRTFHHHCPVDLVNIGTPRFPPHVVLDSFLIHVFAHRHPLTRPSTGRWQSETSPNHICTSPSQYEDATCCLIRALRGCHLSVYRPVRTSRYGTAPAPTTGPPQFVPKCTDISQRQGGIEGEGAGISFVWGWRQLLFEALFGILLLYLHFSGEGNINCQHVH